MKRFYGNQINGSWSSDNFSTTNIYPRQLKETEDNFQWLEKDGVLWPHLNDVPLEYDEAE